MDLPSRVLVNSELNLGGAWLGLGLDSGPIMDTPALPWQRPVFAKQSGCLTCLVLLKDSSYRQTRQRLVRRAQRLSPTGCVTEVRKLDGGLEDCGLGNDRLISCGLVEQQLLLEHLSAIAISA
jgi:hypothetical protein